MTGWGLTVALVVMAVPAFAASWCNLRHWGAHRQLPFVLVTADQLRDIPPEWPLRDTRWPRPRDLPRANMDAAVAAVYARLCREKALGLRALGDGVTVVGAAWLGLQLPGLSTYVTADHSDDATFGFLADSSYWAIMAPMFLVLLGSCSVPAWPRSTTWPAPCIATQHSRRRPNPWSRCPTEGS